MDRVERPVATSTGNTGFSLTMDDLLDRLARDVDGAFGDFVAAFRDDVYSGLRRIHREHGEDLTQEAFIRAYLALKQYEPDRIRALRLRGWIWTIALNLGRNHLRDRARRPTPVALVDHHAVFDAEPPDTQAWDRRLAALTAPQRRAVVLRHVVGLPYVDIADALDRPEGTVKADVHRGLARLREIIDKESP